MESRRVKSPGVRALADRLENPGGLISVSAQTSGAKRRQKAEHELIKVEGCASWMHGAGYFAPMQIAPALRHAFRFVSLLVVVYTMVFAVPSLFGEEIDPRDYIGEDIAK